MALKQYTGPYYEGVEIVIMGESFGLITPGETLVVPDELAEQVAWPEDLWRDGTADKDTRKEKDVK